MSMRSRLTRRELLQVGFSTYLGAGLASLQVGKARASSGTIRSPGTPRAKSVILVFLTGGASQLETFDLKPEAPAEIRGDFSPIETRTPGIRVCEHLPRIAERSGEWALVRSLSHGENGHLPATHRLLTGTTMPLQRGSDLDNVLSRRDWPCYAAALNYVRPRSDGIPSGVTLPHQLIEGPLTWPGQHAGLLGAKHDPWFVTQNPNDPNFRVDALRFPEGFSLARMQSRRTLLEQLDESSRVDPRSRTAPLGELTEMKSYSSQQDQAFAMLATSGAIARAFEIDREPDKVRDRYGRHMFGQTLLLARRLAQAGVPIIQANMGIVQTWDTHVDNLGRLRDHLLPPLDRGYSALLDDLRETGLLDETLVILVGEFGRTPRISTLPGSTIPGRDHWAYVYSGLFAGAGVRGGQVIGKSDRIAAHPETQSYTPFDIGATVYDALGVDVSTEIIDPLGRPLRINQGSVIEPLYSGSGASA